MNKHMVHLLAVVSNEKVTEITHIEQTERLPYRYCTIRNFCWISNNRFWVASISTDIFQAVHVR